MKRQTTLIHRLTATAIFTALIAVSCYISIPTPTVPITLQTFAVYFALFVGGAKTGGMAIALYIALGAVGLPVFSGFSGGVGRLFDATGGFILGFLVLAFVYGALGFFFKGKWARIVLCSVSLLSLYLFGSLWYCLYYLEGENFLVAFSLSTLPFLIPDVVKIVLAHMLAARIGKYIKVK